MTGLSIWDALDGGPRVDGVTRRAGQLRKDITRVDRELTRLCERIEQGRNEADREGLAVEQKLSVPMQAFYGAWLRTRDVPKRIELSQITEAPIPEEHDVG